MSYRNRVIYAAMGVAAGVAPALSSAHTRPAADIAPLAAHVEIVPVADAGYAAAPGYRIRSGHEYVWVGGDYPGSRHGHHWDFDPRKQDGGRWRHELGRWGHD